MTTLSLNNSLHDPLLDVMNFLNEIVVEYPLAISFAPGRPLEHLFDTESHVNGLRRYVAREALRRRIPDSAVWNQLAQYDRTNGFITEVVAKQLLNDQQVAVHPEGIMITVGAQEAMTIALLGLFNAERDILLVGDPTYVGITGIARLLRVRVWPVPSENGRLTPSGIEQAITEAGSFGRVRGLYVIPDFDNPSGACMTIEDRRDILALCRKHEMVCIEDDAYGMFSFDGRRLPTLKQLDPGETVVYIPSYSKTLFPGIRIGCLVADQLVASGRTLARELSKVKSLLTINTPGLCQAVLAEAIISNGFSLGPIVEPKTKRYRTNCAALLSALVDSFGLDKGYGWNSPQGGFFVTLTLPFPFGPKELRQCASEYGVIVSPMRFFAFSSRADAQVRLSFSYLDEQQIIEGVRRFASFCYTVSVARAKGTA